MQELDTMIELLNLYRDWVTSDLNAELDTFKTPYDRGLYVGTNQLSKSLCQEKNELDLKAWNVS